MNVSLRTLAGSLLLSFSSLIASTDVPLVEAQECRPRAGLPNFLAKATTPRKEVRVAFLGGSITAQPGWRPKTLAHFQALWPETTFLEINAAIGGTGSDLGVHRLGQDVLAHLPDLLFVEFAVNDGATAPERILRSMEGIVRQTWRTLPGCDICFVYTLTEALAPAMLEGKFPRAASAMEQVAGHYGIPSIHLAMEVAALAREGNLIWRGPLPQNEEEKSALQGKFVFAPDTVHPHLETGHLLYLQAIVRSLDPIRAASGEPVPHVLGTALTPDNYEHAKLIPISSAQLSPGFEHLSSATDSFAQRWSQRLTTLHRAQQPGETLHFRFRGTRCALYDIVGPECGQVVVTLNALPPRTVPRFDAYCTSHRLSTFLIGEDLLDSVHSVTIEVHPDQPDKATILAQRNQTMDKPERFDGTAFYPGAILLVGELLP